MTVSDQLSEVWNQLLSLIDKVVSPDWGSIVGLIPLLLLFGVILPLLSLAVLAWFIYFVTKPRPKVSYEEGPRPAPLDPSGNPIFPVGEPYCLLDATIYPPGTSRCDRDREPLSVICPMCGIGRDAEISTCGNCGLVLKIEARARVMRPAGPPPGGGAVA